MKVNLSYDVNGLQVELPETSGFQGIWRPSEPPVIEDPPAAITKALETPLKSRPLNELAQGRQSVCIVISDITRPVPNKIILPPLLKTLEQAGIKKEDITILIATGIHRPNEGDELIALVGKEIAAEYRIINHFSKQADDMILVGKINGEVPALINRHYVAADLKILTGFI
ncbi:MAG: lactate racemase domain-containing protein, partial [Pseudomonadota bacterium]|nr:lactate racemase domain-containing protein [Pseudomonadota bacterium]